MPNDIKVEYYFNVEPYRLNGNLFDTEYLMTICRMLQERYLQFADRINEQKGYIELNISHSDFLENGIHDEAYIMAVSEELIDEINAWEAQSKKA